MLRESGSWRRCGSSQAVLRVRPSTECQFLTSLREARRSSRRPQIADSSGGHSSARLLYERSVRPAYAMDTLSTGYQRPPQPRIIARSWPRLCLTATTTPMAQDTLAREVACLISNGCLHLTKVGFLHGYLLPLAPARRIPLWQKRRREA